MTVISCSVTGIMSTTMQCPALESEVGNTMARITLKGSQHH